MIKPVIYRCPFCNSSDLGYASLDNADARCRKCFCVTKNENLIREVEKVRKNE